MISSHTKKHWLSCVGKGGCLTSDPRLVKVWMVRSWVYDALKKDHQFYQVSTHQLVITVSDASDWSPPLILESSNACRFGGKGMGQYFWMMR